MLDRPCDRGPGSQLHQSEYAGPELLVAGRAVVGLECGMGPLRPFTEWIVHPQSTEPCPRGWVAQALALGQCPQGEVVAFGRVRPLDHFLV